MNISLLPNNPLFFKQVAQWYMDEWGEASTDFSLAYFESILASSMHCTLLPKFLIAQSDDEIIGVLQLKLTEHKDYPEFEHWIGGVYVSKEKRGKGVAKALILGAIKQAKIFNFPTLYLQCEAHNDGLYHQLGFKSLIKTTHYGTPTTIMKMELATEKAK